MHDGSIQSIMSEALFAVGLLAEDRMGGLPWLGHWTIYVADRSTSALAWVYTIKTQEDRPKVYEVSLYTGPSNLSAINMEEPINSPPLTPPAGEPLFKKLIHYGH